MKELINGWMEELKFRVPEWGLGIQSDLRPFLFCQLLPDSLAIIPILWDLFAAM